MSPRDASAVLLVGGRSARMGRPKALLPFDGEPLVVHLVRRLGRTFHEVVVVAAVGQELPPLDARIVRDDVPDQGPVVGLARGLGAIDRDVAFVAACDVPFLRVDLAVTLLGMLGKHEAVVPRFDDRPQPLHAVYRKRAAEHFAARAACGELRTIESALALQPKIVDEAEIRRLDPEGLSFRNLNHTEDYEAALTLWPLHRAPSIAPSGTDLFSAPRK